MLGALPRDAQTDQDHPVIEGRIDMNAAQMSHFLKVTGNGSEQAGIDALVDVGYSGGFPAGRNVGRIEGVFVSAVAATVGGLVAWGISSFRKHRAEARNKGRKYIEDMKGESSDGDLCKLRSDSQG